MNSGSEFDLGLESSAEEEVLYESNELYEREPILPIIASHRLFLKSYLRFLVCCAGVTSTEKFFFITAMLTAYL